ncbi:TIGR03943 family putative permease subunit [Sporosarcina limicola]|uniref:Membrane protein n=1 Tax=Sporosarcina limicola TaxID=34101 RepID=A0A927MJ11_9BACL|nr:TIGR03943 family protein [Sporosarcina limicola]MBE1555295.1 putative membrane protein [Sporosarcina limicola]
MQEERDYNTHAFFRGIILLGFFLLLFRLLVSGDIFLYIAPKMIPFSYFALVILLVLGVMQLWRSRSDNEDELYCNCGFDHAQTGSRFQTLFIYSLFVLPVLTGLWFPTTLLDSSIVAKRGIQYGSGLYSHPPGLPSSEDDIPFDVANAEDDPNDPTTYVKGVDVLADLMKEIEEMKVELLGSEKISMDDERYMDIMNFFSEDLDLFIGKEIELIGFVYKEPDFEDNHFVIARFGMTCCVADATVYGIMSKADEMDSLKEDEWIRATGRLSKIHLYDADLPFLEITTIEKIDQPEDPYVY